MTLLAAFQVWIHRVTGQTDVVVGTPIDGRALTETEPLIGFFVNNLVLRTRLSADLSFRDLLRRVRAGCLGAYAHQDLPFERLVQAISPERDLGRAPLFQVMFTLDHGPRDLRADTPSSPSRIEARRVPVPATTAKLDLSVAMGVGPRGHGGVVEYAADLFDPATVDRMIAQITLLLEGIARDPDLPLHALPILPDADRRQVLGAWNDTAAPYPAGRCAHDLFAAQVARAPEAPALRFEGSEISYGDLDRRAARLARRLRALGVGPGVRVGVSMRRSPEAIVAILGTLVAGGAWVPLDPAYPRDRLAFMMADAGIAVLCTQSHVVEGLPAHGATVLVLDGDAPEQEADGEALPASGVTSRDAAYVIYTSGSTGRPKGVVVEHEGLGNVAAVHARAFGVGPGSRVLQFSSMSFDASVWETMMALLNGATLVLAREDAILPGPDLLRTLREEAVSVLTVPPSVLAALPYADLPALGTIVVAGEACSADLVDRWSRGRHFWNAYGPTEATVCATMGECFAGRGKPSIGRPIANARVFVLDARLGPAPIGVPGEICVGGVGLARGYLGRAALTAEKFVPSPFAAGERLYRTGDLGRWSRDGTLEFLGRIDDQVKLRGFRIELGEIDAVLRRHPGVADAVTLVRGDRLVAYLVDAADPPSANDLLAWLRQGLPEHMVPAAIVRLAAMPLTPSGKVDRRALPAPDFHAPEHTYVAPEGAVEEAICAVFAEVLGVLGVLRVGARDGFFELGGHSLLAAQAMARVRDALGVELPLRALFEAPTPAGLAAAVQAARAEGLGVAGPAITRVPRGGDLQLSFAQERLWFLNQLAPGDASYVVPLALRIEGRLDAGALARALTALSRRHEVLRTTFRAEGGRPAARIHEAGEVALPVQDLAGDEAPEAAARREAARDAAEPFDLARGPAPPREAPPARRRRSRPPPLPAPHRRRRVGRRRPAPRAGRPLRIPRRRRAPVAAGPPHPVRRPRRLAAAPPRGRDARSAARVLEGAPRRRPARAGSASRSPAPAGALPPRRPRRVHRPRRHARRARGRRPRRGGDALHDLARGLRRPAPPHHWAARSRRRSARRGPRPRGDRGPRRLLHEHARPPRRDRRRAPLHGLPEAGPRDLPRRLRAPGHPLRAAGAGPRARA